MSSPSGINARPQFCIVRIKIGLAAKLGRHLIILLPTKSGVRGYNQPTERERLSNNDINYGFCFLFFQNILSRKGMSS